MVPGSLELSVSSRCLIVGQGCETRHVVTGHRLRRADNSGACGADRCSALNEHSSADEPPQQVSHSRTSWTPVISRPATSGIRKLVGFVTDHEARGPAVPRRAHPCGHGPSGDRPPLAAERGPHAIRYLETHCAPAERWSSRSLGQPGVCSVRPLAQRSGTSNTRSSTSRSGAVMSATSCMPMIWLPSGDHASELR